MLLLRLICSIVICRSETWRLFQETADMTDSFERKLFGKVFRSTLTK